MSDESIKQTSTLAPIFRIAAEKEGSTGYDADSTVEAWKFAVSVHRQAGNHRPGARTDAPVLG